MQHKFNIASFSARRRSMAHKHSDSLLETPKSSSDTLPEDSILNNLTSKQYQLYESVLSDAHRSNSRSKSAAKSSLPSNLLEIQDVINDQIRKKEDLGHFRTMYSIQTPETKGSGKYPFVLETKQEKSKLLLRKLSSNPEEIMNVYQNQLLRFYHYRDLEKETRILTSKYIPKDINASMHRRYSQGKNKIDVKYLQGDFQTNRHIKLSKSVKQTEKVYAKHDENAINKEKLIRFMKDQKEVKESVRLARRNMSYKRSLNIDRIKYLIGSMGGGQERVKETPQERVVNGMFFRFSNREGNEKSRYREMTLEKFMDLFKKLELREVSEEAVKGIFNESVSYKSKEKILCKQDFLTVIKRVSQLVYKEKQGNGMVRFVNNYILPRRELYQQQMHQIYNVYKTSIQRFIQNSKIGFCLETLFKFKDQEDAGGKKDFYNIVEAFTYCSLIPPFESNKIHYFYSYLSMGEGVSMEEFKEVIVMVVISQELGLRNMEGQGRVKAYLEGKDEETIILALTKFFNKCNIYEKVLSSIILPKEEY